jgi:hypothetical protein
MVPTKVSQTNGMKNHVDSDLGIDIFRIINTMPPGWCFNTGYFLAHIISPLQPESFPEGRKSHALPLRVHLDTSRVGSSDVSI